MNNNNNLKDILDFKPKINKEKMSYSREEKDGFRSIAFYSSVNHTPILFSKIDSNTIDLCNGELKIIDIVETIFSSIKGPSWIELINNTVSLIFYLTDLEVINSDSLNPFLTYTTLKLDEEIQILEFCYYQQDKLDYFLEKVFSNNEYYYYHYNPLLNKYDNNIKNLKKELDKRENKILIIKKSIEIVKMGNNGSAQQTEEVIEGNVTNVEGKIYSYVDGHKPYMDQMWWWFLPYYIYIVLAIIYIIVMLFAGVGAGPFLGWLIFAVLIGLLIWWLCDIRELGWAWFILLLPLIVAMLVAIVGAGVTSGIIGSEAIKMAVQSAKIQSQE